MNVKGASASGKSTMRPLQKQLAARLGVAWTDFALISPDIWRKFLLDYAALGAARRYAGTLTGHEIEIIDKKLDGYMSGKARNGRMTHLLIDRFRFDSFAHEPDEENGHRLLTRFGDDIHMFFMITPPEATVERAWLRGEQFGRYKAVDDLLAHNVEAYSGIPRLFFTWALRADKRVHFEFIDNSVALGTPPRTVAFGQNGKMNILDIKCLLDIDRYRQINIDALTPTEVYHTRHGQTATPRADFLLECVQRIPVVDVANRDTGQIFARIEAGKFTFWDPSAFMRAEPDAAIRSAFECVASPPPRETSEVKRPADLQPTHALTLGQWGKHS